MKLKWSSRYLKTQGSLEFLLADLLVEVLDLFPKVWLLNQSKLLESRQSSLFPSLIHNQPILECEDSRSREVHFFARIRLLQSADCKIMEGNSRMSAASDPATDYIWPACDQGVLVGMKRDVWKGLLIGVSY